MKDRFIKNSFKKFLYLLTFKFVQNLQTFYVKPVLHNFVTTN